MARIERRVHGVPIWLMREYLLDLGGQEAGEGKVVGNGWSARYARVEDYKIGSLVIGAVHLEIEGKENALATLEPDLNLKLMRGGG